MHPEADAFLDAIFDNPDDDTPRLVYADWLQEHGQENYAQFIRLQCAAAREKLWSDEANRLWEEIGRVWTRLDQEWWPATRDTWLRHGWQSQLLDAADFDRGFFRDTIAATSAQLLRYSESCWSWLPLPFTTLNPHDTEYTFARWPRLGRIRRLGFTDWYEVEPSLSLVTSPLMTNLELLDLTAGVLTADFVEHMLSKTLSPRLRELRVRVYDPDADDFAGETTRLRELRKRLETQVEQLFWRSAP